MKASDLPQRFNIPFASAATGTEIVFPIPEPSQTGGHASLTTGFAPINSQPVQSGGIPPWGADMNGILKMLSLWSQWVAAGGPAYYDATFSTDNGGYPKGTLLQSASVVGKFFFCLADDNTNNPDSTPTNWLPFFIENVYPPVGASSKLAGSAVGASKLASWTAGELVAAETLGGRAWKGTGLTLSFNGAGTGAGGMDTGAMPAGSPADLAIYAIYNPATNAWSTLGTIASVSTAPSVYAGANMPAGYTASALLWIGKTTGGNFLAFQQIDRQVNIAGALILSGANSTPGTTVSVASVVPPAARACGGYAFTGGAGQGFISAGVQGIGEIEFGGNVSTGCPFSPIICTGQLLAWRSTSNPAFSIFVSSFVF